jgi:ABC-type uncharacterized transport system substrate-binding protein
MRALLAFAVLLVAGLAVSAASAHPHLWLQQHVRVVAKGGKYTHVEIEWRFDPFSSEIEIPLIDEDKDGKFSAREVKVLGGEMLPELAKIGYFTWISTGGKDFRPARLPQFSARIDDPASFTLPDWDRSAGDGGMAMPPNKRANEPPPPRKRGPRNLVYVMRFALPEPSRTVSITTYDPDDFMRIEVDKTSLPAGCALAKHPAYKAEFIRGYPVFADTVTCQLP